MSLGEVVTYPVAKKGDSSGFGGKEYGIPANS
jgi:hypothetical protein